MKKTGFKKRFLALLLCFLMVFSAIPTTAFAAEPGKIASAAEEAAPQSEDGIMPIADYGKVHITSNVEDVIWTDDSWYNITGITDKPVIWVIGIADDGTVNGNKNRPQQIGILNYEQLSEAYTLDYIAFDGHKVFLSDFTKTSQVLDTSDWNDSSFQGKKIQYSITLDGYPFIVFPKNNINTLPSDANIVIQFKKVEAGKANLTVNAGEYGEFVKMEYVGEEGGFYNYKVYAKPDMNYQLSSYTVEGEEEPVELNLTADNYRWVEGDNFFTISIAKDTEITLNFTPATAELEFWSYVTRNNPESSWNVDMFGRIFDSNGVDKWNKAFEDNKKSVPLLEELGAKFFFKVNIKGYKEYGTEGENCQIKLYSGDKADESKILFDSTKGNYILNNTPTVNNNLRGDRCGGIQIGVSNIPSDLSNIYVELDWVGYKFTGSYPVQMAKDIAEVKEFAAYYTDTYGLDKQGREAYTEEEKASDAYKRYAKYGNFRYVLRLAYNEYLNKISGEGDEAARKALLAEGKQALDNAAIGKDCNAVVWSFLEKDGVKAIPVMVAVPNDVTDYSKNPSVGTTADTAMRAALEALYPGNWTYTYHSTQFGSFVNKVSAGGKEDIGNIVIDTEGTTGNNYGFWYYNGKFSDWGVSNYNPYDGDVMWWGGGDVEKNWDWAKLRLYYGSDEALEAALTEKGITKTIDQMSAAEIEAAFADLKDGSGKAFFRRYGQFRDVENWEDALHKIAAIGTVTSKSGEKIEAARKAYDALTEDEKKKVTNYTKLVAAEEVFKKMDSLADVTAQEALDKVLGYLGGLDLGVGSIGGEWAILALARGDQADHKDVFDTYYKKALTYIQNEIDEKGRLDKNKASDNARLILALTAIGKDATKVGGYDLLQGLNDMSYISRQGINGVVFTLIALDTHDYAPTGLTREDLIQYLLTKRLADGGWALDGSETDVDISAMVIQALAPYYETRTDVKEAVDGALDKLKTLQADNGGFNALGGIYNAETIAQMIVALCSLNIDPTTWNGKNAVDALLHFFDSDKNMFKHRLTLDVDQMATEQSAYALAAYRRYMQNHNTLYDMTDVTIEGSDAEHIPGGDKDDETTLPGDDKNDATLPGDNTGNNVKPGTGTNTPGNTTKTGDNTMMYQWILLAVIALGAGTILISRRKKENQ